MEQNLAVLIDFENIAAGTEKEGLGRFNIQSLMQRFTDKGRVLIARSYADWGRFSRFKQALLSENVTMMELTSHGMQDKNRADIALVVDALELAFTRDYIHTFVVVSGDSDFTPMVLKMRELNKRVIGCGTRKSTSRLLIQACDEFIFYDSIVQPQAANRRPKVVRPEGGKPTKEGAWALLVDSLEGLQRENPEPPLAGLVKQAMLRKAPDFSETDLGYGTFTRFLEAAQEEGYVDITRDTKSGGYRVDGVDAGEEGEEGEARPAAATKWVDEYLPAGVEPWLDVLAEAGIRPLSAPARMDVLDAIVEVANARRKRRKKNTIHFVAEDVKKQLRRTHPNLPLESIREVLEALRISGQLVHRDGGAIRTASATFKIAKDAVALNKALLGTYLGTLRDAGCELVDSNALAALFLGDRERAREVEEAIAWLATAGEAEAGGEDLNDVDLDDLLVAGPASSKAPKAPKEDEPPAAEAAEEAPKKKKKSRKQTTKETAATADAESEAPLEAAEPAPPSDTSADDEEEEPAKPKRRRIRKKKDPEPEAVPSDLDALLQPSGD